MNRHPHRVLMVDNYDSFTYNLVQYFEMAGSQVTVCTNDGPLFEAYKARQPHLVVLSPGPGRPSPDTSDVRFLNRIKGQVAVFGVCLGMQAMGVALGAEVIHAPRLMHGKVSRLKHHGCGLFNQLPNPLEVVRYHSLMINTETLPSYCEITARSLSDHVAMAIEVPRYDWYGVQFHPESIMTKCGMQIVENMALMSMNKITDSF